MEAPPRMQTREGEPIVNCIAEVAVADSGEARQVLDGIYEREGDDTWVEMYPLSEDERILRATMTLLADRLTIETASEARIDRVLTVVTSKLSGVTIVRDEREPLRPGELPKPPGHLSGPDLDPTQMNEAMAQVQDHLERRWCDEPVPALGGLTPRQAASDPTRREALERLLLDFETHDLAAIPEAITMRPDRLRQLLGVD
jgi:hypothetical protein